MSRRPRAAAPSIVAFLALGGTAATVHAATTAVHVVLDGAAAMGAEVFVDGQSRGHTDDQGNLAVDRDLLVESKTVLTARLKVFEQPAYLPGRGDAASPAGWVMRVYVTSVVIGDDGVVHTSLVTDRAATQQLVLARDNVLIGLQLVASADWDMSSADFLRLMQAFQNASLFLWNATDGQFVFERVKLADQTQDWNSANYRLYADNTTRGRAVTGGFLGPNIVGQTVGSYMSVSWRDSMIHLQDNLLGDFVVYKTFVHEFGHLGFNLADEYSDVSDEVCTERLKRDADAGTPFSPYGEKAACIMNTQREASKFCSDQAPNSHNRAAFQVDDCWAGIVGGYSDRGGARWKLKTPVTRNQIVGTLRDSSGSTARALPPEWNTNFVVNNLDWVTPLCKPFYQSVKFSDGSPAGFATVFLLLTSVDPSGHQWISEGKTFGKTKGGENTDDTGRIAVIGAHQGDKVQTITEFNLLSTCPSGTLKQGPLGVSDADSDGDHVPDAFDNCPSRFNPMVTDGVWFQQSPGCPPCTSNADCAPGLACNTDTHRCIQPNCRSDADCGSGRRCVGTGAGAACTDMAGTTCTGNTSCGVAFHCDSGPGTSGTNRCVPNAQTGQPGVVCSDNAQCVSGNCSGLEPDYAVGWRPGTCSANSKKALGEYCFQQQQCASGLCGDTGVDANGVGRCMPNGNGLPGDICSRDNQCTSRNCVLAPRTGGGWQAGHCSASALKALGDSCSQGNQCASNFCDTGLETSMTNRCMPNGDGQAGQICTNDKQCVDRNCALTGNLAAAVPGNCAPKKGLNVACQADWQCNSGYCESHSGTSWTYRCMPSTGTGQSGDACSNDNQCAAQNCAGLTKDIYGAWVPGNCAVKGRLGDCCTAHNQCASTYCAPGPFQACSFECMPNKNGQGYDLCSDNVQCVSQDCIGLRGDGYNHWIPGHCSDLQGLGKDCAQHSECASGRCDRGDNSSRTNKCVPNGNGRTGEFCTDHRHCASQVCEDLHQQGSDWIPGHCR